MRDFDYRSSPNKKARRSKETTGIIDLTKNKTTSGSKNERNRGNELVSSSSKITDRKRDSTNPHLMYALNLIGSSSAVAPKVLSTYRISEEASSHYYSQKYGGGQNHDLKDDDSLNSGGLSPEVSNKVSNSRPLSKKVGNAHKPVPSIDLGPQPQKVDCNENDEDFQDINMLTENEDRQQVYVNLDKSDSDRAHPDTSQK